MKIWGKRKKNYILEVTPYELDAIKTALFEWQGVEDDCVEPDRRFDLVFGRIARTAGVFDLLKEYKRPKALPESKPAKLPQVIDIKVKGE